jgi:hypothetical protein
MMAVAMGLDSGIPQESPRVLFEGDYLPTAFSFPYYDVSSDGERFLMLQPIESETGGATEINVVFNWSEELKSLVPKE